MITVIIFTITIRHEKLSTAVNVIPKHSANDRNALQHHLQHDKNLNCSYSNKNCVSAKSFTTAVGMFLGFSYLF